MQCRAWRSVWCSTAALEGFRRMSNEFAIGWDSGAKACSQHRGARPKHPVGLLGCRRGSGRKSKGVTDSAQREQVEGPGDIGNAGIQWAMLVCRLNWPNPTLPACVERLLDSF
ncbi:hypothetical protein I7I51_04467 [Histoplasma capsulatum]|uniref:Uncharacterized protein n=1 Tax=Ajellomyces capsulatus TaxID=5037 RepID=A0A8A1MAN0_AJECA|nr:hypothetical protein I7I51_04467 [Histoplasma capsulatum]